MLKAAFLLPMLFMFSATAAASTPAIVDIQTNFGTLSVQLNTEKAPITTANFLSYVYEGFYTDTLFHRVVPGFVIQGGGFSASDGKQKATHAPIKLESNNSLSNLRGTIAMARTSVSDSATAQFFINTVDNKFLDYTPTNPGYAVFGQVIENSLSVVDAISKTPTNSSNDQPLKSVIIQAARPRYGQLQFDNLQTSYAAGENLKLVVQETQVVRDQVLDLWVAVVFNNQLFFISPENPALLSLNAKPFQRKVPINVTQHEIFNIKLPAGIAGNYQVYAIFNDPDKDVSNITQTLRSNLLQAQVAIR